MLISMLRTIIKKKTSTGTVTKLFGRRPKFLLPSLSEGDVKRGKIIPKMAVGKLHYKIKSWDYKDSKPKSIPVIPH